MEMEWIDRLNQAISYMEEHLTEEISYEELGHIAHCSSYHFQRMFGYIAGVSCRSTFVEEKCLWLPLTCVMEKRSLMLR